MSTDKIRNEIIQHIKTIDPERVILFGSYANGTHSTDSDVDIYVVTKDNTIPQSFDENIKIKKRVYSAMKTFRKKYASDIIVHTLPVHKKFLQTGSSFSKEIFEKGIILI